MKIVISKSFPFANTVRSFPVGVFVHEASRRRTGTEERIAECFSGSAVLFEGEVNERYARTVRLELISVPRTTTSS